MKYAFDFQSAQGPISLALQMILADHEPTSETADVVLTESVDKVLHYLQKTDKKVVQLAYEQHHPMTHLIEDYPNRLRVVELEKAPNSLVAIINAMRELVE